MNVFIYALLAGLFTYMVMTVRRRQQEAVFKVLNLPAPMMLTYQQHPRWYHCKVLGDQRAIETLPPVMRPYVPEDGCWHFMDYLYVWHGGVYATLNKVICDGDELVLQPDVDEEVEKILTKSAKTDTRSEAGGP